MKLCHFDAVPLPVHGSKKILFYSSDPSYGPRYNPMGSVVVPDPKLPGSTYCILGPGEAF
jgi:hypothetical protein